MEKERKVELVLWGLFLVMLFLFVLIFINLDSEKTSTNIPTNNVINSYNTNNYYYYNYNYLEHTELRYDSARENRDSGYRNLGYRYLDSEDKEIRYDSHYSEPISSPFCFECLEVGIPDYSNLYTYNSVGSHKKEYAFGSYADSFRVKITNKGNSDYFRVEYTFYDCEGKSKTEEGRYYVSNGEEKELYVRYISHDRDAYCSWNYNVIREHN
jgi:hypothetical protein